MMKKINKQLRIDNVFILVMLVSLIEAIVYVFLIDSKGSYYYISTQQCDPGGDFFLSMLYSSQLKPYDNVFPYPPFAVIICYLLHFITHDVSTLSTVDINEKSFHEIYATNFDYKNLFFISHLIIIVLIFNLVYALFRKKNKNEIKSFVLSFVLLFNCGFLCALVRGNLLLLCLLFLIVFCMFYNYDNQSLRMLSIISLAISFNLKPYVAVFGALFLYDHRYKDAIKTIVISFLLFIVPFCFLKGGFIYNIFAFFKTLKSFASGTYMFGFSSFICTINNLCFSFDSQQSLKGFTSLFALIFCLLLFKSGYKLEKYWEKILNVTLIMILLSTNYGYIIAFMLLPIMFFLFEERQFNHKNLIVLFSFIFISSPFYFTKYHFNGLRYIISNILLILLGIMQIYECVKIKMDRLLFNSFRGS